MSDPITVLADYETLREQIIQPDRYSSETRYFLLKWEPTLGLNGARIVRVLRSLGYYDRKTGDLHDGIRIDLPRLAVLCGFSVPTLKREFGSNADGSPKNPALHKFVQREKNYTRDKVTGQILREENIYRVKMTDPLHDDDLPRLQELWEQKQKGAAPTPKPGKQVPRAGQQKEDTARKAQNEPNGEDKAPARMAQIDPQSTQLESQSVQSESEATQVESEATQSEPSLKNILLLPFEPLNSSSDASEFSASLFPGEEQERGEPLNDAEGLSEPVTLPTPLSPAPSYIRPWERLPEAEQAPWLDKAEQELKENFGMAVWLKTTEKAKGTIRAQRAANLYGVGENGASEKRPGKPAGKSAS